MRQHLLLPREHGAWGILLQPFVAAAIVASVWNPLLPAALLAVLLVFALREPLVVLARQRWVWRDPHPETLVARRTLVWEALLLAVCGLLVSFQVPFVLLTALGGMAFLLTAFAVWMTLKNKQRSVTLQTMSALGLSASALLAGYLGTGTLTASWIWWVWLLHALHSLSGIFVVHARLDAMAAQKNPVKLGAQARDTYLRAVVMQAGNGLFGLALAVAGWWVAVPVLLSTVMNGYSLGRLRDARSLQQPLRSVGLQALGCSLLHTMVVIFALWRQ